MSSLIDIEYLFKTYYKRLYQVAFQIVRNEENAEDIVQEVFIYIWNKKDELNITTTVEGYLVKSTINKALTFIEKNKKMLKIELNDSIENGFDTNSHKNNNYDHEIFQALVEKSLDSLPPKCKSIFVLSRFENMKNKDIATHLDISIKTVENQMTIALSKLNNDLKPKIKNYFPELFYLFFIFFQFL